MTTRAEYRNGRLTFFDDATGEVLNSMAPLTFHDDFTGKVLDSSTEGKWGTVEVALNTAIGLSADAANGIARLALDADSNAEDAVLYTGDQRFISVKHTAFMEMRLAMAVLPTTGVAVVMGLAGDHNLDKDSVAEHAWFRLDASGVLKVETDDTTNDEDDVATGITLTAAEFVTLGIDFADLSDVKFYVNGARVAGDTTFDMSNLSDSEAVMQPYFSLDKASGTGVGTLDIDYVKIWSNRSAA